ncbi:MAG: ribosome assembly RNA-binding protein YhbY [Gammaproteobacteria bacterium]|nr:ribosome assembly RNA-binding protein YhbY [Gammaproteobacteria bacterium]
MNLNEKQKRHLRTLAHNRKPLIIVGDKGLTENLITETDLTLEHHELIKVRVNADDRDSRDAMIKELCDKTKATLIKRIGHIATLYRPAKEPVIKFP